MSGSPCQGGQDSYYLFIFGRRMRPSPIPSRPRIAAGPILLAASLLLLGSLACDRAHSAASAEPPLPPPAWLTGAWSGTFDGTGDVVRALILPSGACRLLNESGLGQVAGTLALGGQTLSGTGSFFLPGPLQVPSIGSQAAFRFEGRAAPADAPPVRMVLVNTGHAWDMTSVDLARDPEAGAAPRLAELAGRYACERTSGGVSSDLDLKADGSFTGRDERGSFTGRLGQPDPAANALTVRLDYTPQGARTPLAFTGLAYVRAGGLVVMTDAGTDQYAGIFAPGPAASAGSGPQAPSGPAPGGRIAGTRGSR